MADALLYLSDEIFKSDEFDMILTRQELGEMTNMAKEGVVRILRWFSADLFFSCPTLNWLTFLRHLIYYKTFVSISKRYFVPILIVYQGARSKSSSGRRKG
jgi:hypothetical protein